MCVEDMRARIKEAVDDMDEATLEQLYWMIQNEIE